jgi:hypothetical protein
MNSDRLDNIFQRINIAVFIVIIFAPCLWMVSTQQAVFSFTEKRKLATFPSHPDSLTEIQGFFSGIDNYLNDHFGFREWMVYRYQREIRKRFDDVEIQSKVIKGTDNWYFFTGDKMLEDFTGKNLRTDNELDEWIKAYRAKKRWLEQQGIQYLLVAVPNKITIYGEFIGEPWAEQKGDTRFSQLKSVLQESDYSTFLDLTPVLASKAREEYVFFKSDTHWTPYGAYLGYMAIAEKMESIFPGSRFKKDFTISNTRLRTCDKKQDSCGDLTTMLLDFDSFTEQYRAVSSSSSCAYSKDYNYSLSNVDETHPKTYPVVMGCDSGELRALVFRDSFFNALKPFFSENFKEVLYLWKNYDQKNIEELLEVFKPDIVIEEKGEREL